MPDGIPISYVFQACHLAFSVWLWGSLKYTSIVNHQLAMVPGRPPGLQSWGQIRQYCLPACPGRWKQHVEMQIFREALRCP